MPNSNQSQLRRRSRSPAVRMMNEIGQDNGDHMTIQLSPSTQQPEIVTKDDSLNARLFGVSTQESHSSHSESQPLQRFTTNESRRAMQRRLKLNRAAQRVLYSGHTASKIKNPTMKKLYLLMEDPRSSWLAWCITMWVAISIVFGITVMIASTSISKDDPIWFPLEIAATSSFFLEFCVRLLAHSFSARGTLQFIISPLGFLDLLSWLPFALELAITQQASLGTQRLGILRIFRLFQLFRVYKDVNMLQLSIEMLIAAGRQAAEPLLALILFIFACVFALGTLLWYAERQTNQPNNSEQYDNIPTCIYAALYSIGQVGSPSGLVPASPWGRLLAFFIIGFGVLITALPSVLIGRNYIEIMMQLQKYRPNTALEQLLAHKGSKKHHREQELRALKMLHEKENKELEKIIAEFYDFNPMKDNQSKIHAQRKAGVFDLHYLTEELSEALIHVQTVFDRLPDKYKANKTK